MAFSFFCVSLVPPFLFPVLESSFFFCFFSFLPVYFGSFFSLFFLSFLFPFAIFFLPLNFFLCFLFIFFFQLFFFILFFLPVISMFVEMNLHSILVSSEMGISWLFKVYSNPRVSWAKQEMRRKKEITTKEKEKRER